MRKLIIFVYVMLQVHAVTSQRNFTTTTHDVLNIGIDKCPQVNYCTCVDDSKQDIKCHAIGESKLKEIEQIYGSNLRRLEIFSWEHDELNFDKFSPFSQLEVLIVRDSELEILNGTVKHPSLKVLSLHNSELTSDAEVCHVIGLLPKLDNLTISNNYFGKFECDVKNTKLRVLNLSENKINHLLLPSTVKHLNVSKNLLTSFENISTELTDLDISCNSLKSWPSSDNWKFPNLRTLGAAKLNIQTGFQLDAPVLESLIIDGSALRYLNFHKIKTPKLKRLSARHLVELRNVAGQLSSTVNHVEITDTMLRTLPADFITSSASSSNSPHKMEFAFTTSRLLCHECLLKWSLPVYLQTNIRKECNMTREEIASATCVLGVVANDTGIQYGKYGKPTALSCFSYGTPSPKISWWRFRPSALLGSYDPKTDKISYTNVSDIMRESYSIQSGGSLLIHSPNRSHVERYVCVVENNTAKEWGIYQLDYLDWYGYDVFHSVFWGGLATSLIVCLISFLLNITWILTRKSALWWIQRAERLSRVRKMVEAMEKYRVRQMESLHQKYTNRVQIVRDNYHQQVEALRVSYAAQQEKFQNYKAAQVDAVHSHLDAMRDGYNNQLGRVREYGSKRAEQLWESYERQVNRMRTFSLQHRLKMMRQYKVKQRYVNKLLESFQASSPDVQLENEEKVRAALELADDIGTIDGSIDTPSRLSRSSSFHSLPEYVIDEQGNVRPGIIPTSSAAIRFPKPTTSSTSNGASTSSPSSSGPHRSPDSPPQK
ncbi:hypothetical protein GCK72_009814 [Caenorhabditis remanei]|uniref:Ig-like domain-containing protein n=1 Tax=Caenorhabditis remanei TaxID=31234 RepID=A0A6A5H1G2_CAERE|nr:hypothetical protein GCK72_009814 [Caenorhabditis remanei]KAF1761558.1 hypothetical protein GCK72_009814 [Caenorhabditis remanei]